MGRPFASKFDFDFLLDTLMRTLHFCDGFITLFSLVKILVGQVYFLILALGNDIQLTLAAIFNVIVSKRCVEFCGS